LPPSLQFFCRSGRAGAPARAIHLSALSRASHGSGEDLAVEEARFGARLRYTIDAGPDAGRALVPAMLVHTLVENGVKHGIAQLRGHGTLEVVARVAGDRLTVEVIDTRSLAGGISLIATAVGRLRRDGGTFEQAVALSKKLAGKIPIYAVADTLEYLKRSGRVSGAQALFGSMLKMKPILEVANGVVHPADRVRTREKAVERMKELVASRVPAGSRIHACTLHTNAPERAAGVADWVQERYHCVEHWIAEAGPVIGARAGPGVVGLCWYREEDAK